MVLPRYPTVPNSSTSALYPYRELHGSEFKRLTRDSITFSFIVISEEEENSKGIGDAMLNQDYHLHINYFFLKEKHQLLFAYDRNILH